ncbi:MAG TPA: hypothetical protein VKT77_23470 [Chthonomonadaceae bacterium]|nr:hypothetical protein [Chthonomonadaceae bacterium]
MSQTITMRVPDDTADWLRASARRGGRSVSDLGASLLEEARRVSEFAEIEFRTFGGERQVCLTGGLRLWKVIMVAQDYEMDPAQTAAHFNLPVWRVQAAFAYYQAYPQGIDDAVAEVRSQTFELLRRKLPRLERQRAAASAVPEESA